MNNLRRLIVLALLAVSVVSIPMQDIASASDSLLNENQIIQLVVRTSGLDKDVSQGRYLTWGITKDGKVASLNVAVEPRGTDSV